MSWFILGQIVVYALVWAALVLIEPSLGCSFLPWLLAFGFVGEPLIMPLFDTDLTKPIGEALRTNRMSRWVPFIGGVLGAIGWVAATVATWWFFSWFNSFVAITVALFLTMIWVAFGIVGSLAFVSEIGKSSADSNSPSSVT